MAKAALVTTAELHDLRERALDLGGELHDIEDRLRRQLRYADDVVTPAQFAASFAALAARAAGLASAIALIAGSEEERAQLEARLKGGE